MVEVDGNGIGIIVGVVGGDVRVAVGDSVGMSAGAAHISSSSRSGLKSGLGAAAAHFGDDIALLPWCSSQWALAAAALCLSVRGLGFGFLRFAAGWLRCVPPGRKNASWASRLRYRFACSVTLATDDLGVTLKLGNVSRRLLITVPPLPLRLTVVPVSPVIARTRFRHPSLFAASCFSSSHENFAGTSIKRSPLL